MADLDPSTGTPPASDPVPVPVPAPAAAATEPPLETASVSRAPKAGPVADDSADASDPDVMKARERMLEIARHNSEHAARLAALHTDFTLRGELLFKAVPERYLQLVGDLRTAVRTFNAALVGTPGQIIPHIQWVETPNVALRDPYSGEGMRVRIARTSSYFELVLRFASRPGKVDVPLIEGFGAFGRSEQKRKALMRIEGWVEGGKVIYWFHLDFKRLPMKLAELPDRIVMAVASHDYALLTRDLSPQPTPPEADAESSETVES